MAEANQPGLELSPQAHRTLEYCRWVIDLVSDERFTLEWHQYWYEAVEHIFD
ncbi:MAG: hypothetical protein ACFFGZ_13110 [Candidatus Thorarchaeota archaeon]